MRALAISFVLHLLLLWPRLPQPATERASVPLSALLQAIDRPAPSVPARREVPRPVAVPGQPDVLSVPGRQADVPSVPEPSAAVPAPSSLPAGEPSPPVTVPASRTPSAEGLDADGLRQFRLALAREARRFKRYPARALEAGWSGTAEVRLTFADAGPRAEVVRGSGHDVLDEAALEMLRQAAPATPMPASLRGRAFAVSLPVVFDLPD